MGGDGAGRWRGARREAQWWGHVGTGLGREDGAERDGRHMDGDGEAHGWG